jgi:hypothetical protein
MRGGSGQQGSVGEDLGCYGTAAAASLGWELLGQGAQAIKDDALLALTSRCHPLTCAR